MVELLAVHQDVRSMVINCNDSIQGRFLEVLCSYTYDLSWRSQLAKALQRTQAQSESL